MKARNFVLSALAVVAAFAAVSCQKSSGDKDGLVSSFEVRQSVKSASKSYKMTLDNETYFLTLSSSVQWPEQFGNYDIKELQDSLVTTMYGDSTTLPIDEAIAKWVCTVDDEVLAGARLEAIDSVPDAAALNNYEMEVTGKIIEFNETTVTYDVSYYSYLGGAHGNTASQPFTYDLASGHVMTLATMFNPGTEKQILTQITEALAQQYNVPVEKLIDQGFMMPLETVGRPFIENDMIVFRYNPYEIAPYSMGTIDVAIPAGALAHELTPKTAAMLGVVSLR